MPRNTRSVGGGGVAWHSHPPVEPRPAESHAAQPVQPYLDPPPSQTHPLPGTSKWFILFRLHLDSRNI